MKKVILVQPRVGDWDEIRSHPSIPCALLSAARLLVKDYNVKLIDQRVDNNWKETLKRELNDAVCVGMTSMTGKQLIHVIEIAKFVKNNSNVKVILGGIHASILPRVTLENEYIDAVVIGEGEITFYELVKAIDGGKPLENIEGVGYKKNKMILLNKPRQFMDLNDLPDLPYELIDMDNYLPEFKGRRTIYIETSRGCVGRCTYCYNSAYHKRKWRSLNAENTIKMIKHIVEKYKIKSFYFLDDNFFVDLKRAKEIMESMLSEKLDIFWESQGLRISSAINMNQDYIKLMEKSGCKKLHFGVESGSDRILKLVKKDITVEQILEANRKFKNTDIVLQYNFMCGFPTETKEDIKKSIDLSLRLMRENKNAIISPICTYSPYPGTELFDVAVNHGFQMPKKLEDFSKMEYGETPWISKKKMNLLKSLYFASMFLDTHRSKDMFASPLIKFFVNVYRPIALFRVKHMFFSFMFELKLKDLYINLTKKG